MVVFVCLLVSFVELLALHRLPFARTRSAPKSVFSNDVRPRAGIVNFHHSSKPQLSIRHCLQRAPVPSPFANA
jgi:hypothetical protein